jgi:hypothetical protein
VSHWEIGKRYGLNDDIVELALKYDRFGSIFGVVDEGEGRVGYGKCSEFPFGK